MSEPLVRGVQLPRGSRMSEPLAGERGCLAVWPDGAGLCSSEDSRFGWSELEGLWQHATVLEGASVKGERKAMCCCAVSATWLNRKAS